MVKYDVLPVSIRLFQNELINITKIKDVTKCKKFSRKKVVSFASKLGAVKPLLAIRDGG